MYQKHYFVKHNIRIVTMFKKNRMKFVNRIEEQNGLLQP